MKTRLLVIVFAAALVAVGGCSYPDPKNNADLRKSVTWDFESNAIIVNAAGDKNLNQYDEMPHTVMIGVFQMDNPSSFNSAIKTEEGVKGLLSGDPLKDKSILSFNRVIVEPGKTVTEALDRAQNTQYIGIIAGFYKLNPAKVARMYEMPIDVTTDGLIFQTKTAEPADVIIRMELGQMEVMSSELFVRPKTPDSQ